MPSGKKRIRNSTIIDRLVTVCECGCGCEIPRLNRDGKPRRFVTGHNLTRELALLGAAASNAKPDAKSIRSASGKKAWADPEYRQRMALSIQRQWADPKFRLKTLSAAHNGARLKWKDADFRKKMTEVGRVSARRLFDPEIRIKNRRAVSARLKRLWTSPEWIAKIKATHANQCGTTRESRPERRLRSFLRELGQSIETHHRFVLDRGYTMPDAYIPSINLAIFTDGVYWHGKASKRARDLEQRESLVHNGISVFIIDQGKSESDQFIELAKLIAQLTECSEVLCQQN